MPFGITRRMGPGIRQAVGFGDQSTGRGTFGGKFGACHCPQGPIGHTFATAPRRGPLAKLLWADLFCYYYHYYYDTIMPHVDKLQEYHTMLSIIQQISVQYKPTAVSPNSACSHDNYYCRDCQGSLQHFMGSRLCQFPLQCHIRQFKTLSTSVCVFVSCISAQPGMQCHGQYTALPARPTQAGNQLVLGWHSTEHHRGFTHMSFLNPPIPII